MKYRANVQGVDTEQGDGTVEVLHPNGLRETIPFVVTKVDLKVDTFQLRRASQVGAGVPWDCESFLTEGEISQGKDYDCPRDFTDGGRVTLGTAKAVERAAVSGAISTGDIGRLAPRKGNHPVERGVPSEWTQGLTQWRKRLAGGESVDGILGI